MSKFDNILNITRLETPYCGFRERGERYANAEQKFPHDSHD